MKKTIALFLSLILGLSLVGTAAAARDPWEAENEAWQLYSMGLFKGTGVDKDGYPTFELDRKATRAEGVTMLVRLLGAEEAALAGSWTTPFTDVPDWAKPYVGYAYENGLTVGTGDTKFSPSLTVTGTQYATFVLRAMGYDSDTDFRWDNAWPFVAEVGIVPEGTFSNGGDFDRGDAVHLSLAALTVGTMKKGGTLLEELTEQGVVDLNGTRCAWRGEGANNGEGAFRFGFACVEGENYARFTVDKATVNGVDCQVIGLDTPEKVKQHNVDMAEKYGDDYTAFGEGTFAAAYLYYDETAALAAAGKYTVDGVVCSTMVYRIWATGELADGTLVKEFALIPYYVET